MSERPTIVDHIKIVQDDDGQWRVRGHSSNGEIIWSTEKYTTYAHALDVAMDTGKPIKESGE